MQPNEAADRLIENLLNGTLTRAEHERLDHLLREVPAFREQYLELTELHLDLARAVPTTGQSPLFNPPSSIPQRQSVASETSLLNSTRRDGWQRSVRICLYAAASLASVVLLWSYLVPPPQSPVSEAQLPAEASGPVQPAAAGSGLPTVIEAANVKIFSWGMAPAIGQTLDFRSEIILTRGMLAIEFASGARAVLSAPSVFTPLSVDTLLVTSGQCSVHAPPGAEGFQVRTPSANVVDLGTRFAVAVDASGDTRINVVEGAATLASLAFDTAQPLMLRQGQSASVDRDSRPATTAAAAAAAGQVAYVDNLPDRVVSYEATRDEAGLAEELISVTVQRGGTMFTYTRDELVRGQLVDFASNAGVAVFCTGLGSEIPQGRKRLELLSDWSLVTGIINPRSAPDKLRPAPRGMEVEFNPPLINGPGPDAILFELQLLVGPESGDTLNISTNRSLARNKKIKIRQFDLSLTSPAALDLAPYQVGVVDVELNSLEELLAAPVRVRNPNVIRSKALATGIDLSELGYAPGESVARLMLHDTFHDGQAVDPVLIVGLP